MRKKFSAWAVSSIGTVGYDGFLLKGYKHLAVMGLDSRHVILTASPFSSTPSSSFCGFFLTLRNCQSSQWPGQALSLWRRGFKTVPAEQHGRRIWKRHNELEEEEEEKKDPSYLGDKTRGRRENVEEREKEEGREDQKKKCHRLTPPPFYSQANSESFFGVSGRHFLDWRGVTHKKRERKWESQSAKRGGRERESEWGLNRCHQLRHVE